jgi:hypothetical protein
VNDSVIFIKTANAVFTNDYWKAAISIDLSAYEEAVEILKNDLSEKRDLIRFSPLEEEVGRIQQALHSLDSKLSNLKLFLPTPGRRRGLLNVVGSTLQFLFGTAMDTDVSSLQNTMTEVTQKQGDIIHEINKQVTYFRSLDNLVKVDHMVLANWTSIIKDFVIQTQTEFNKTVTRLDWVLRLQNATAAIRNLEFVITQLDIQIEELLNAVSHLMAGRVPATLLKVKTLQSILNNVTMTLPHGYSLLVGNTRNTIPWYYSHAQTALLADTRGFVLVISLPLTMSNRIYEIHEIVTFPIQILNNNYAIFQLKDKYIAVSTPLFSYVTLNENELNKCQGMTNKYCPADKAVSDSRTDSCEILLYLRSPRTRDACPRVVQTTRPAPILERRASSVMFYFPEPSAISFRCQTAQGWTTSVQQLHGAGFLHNVAHCHITAGSLQLFAEIQGQTQFQNDAPKIMFPLHTAIVTDSEIESLRKLSDVNRLDALITKLSTLNLNTDVDTLVTLNPNRPHPVSHDHWTIPLLLITTAILISVILIHCLKDKLATLLKCCPLNTSPPGGRDTSPQTTADTTRSSDITRQAQRVHAAAPASTEPRPNISPEFSTYAVEQSTAE